MNTHDLDQIVAALRDLATMTYEYRNKLIEAGFTKEESLKVAATWAASMAQGK